MKIDEYGPQGLDAAEPREAKSPTLRDIAHASGVSIATVSRVLNNTGHPVSDHTRQRILMESRRLGYRPNLVARSLRTDRSAMIGIIADDITSPFTPVIIRGIQDRMKDAGYLCVIINADWDPVRERSAINQLVSRSIDGVIFAESWHGTADEALDIGGKPSVFVHRQFPTSQPNSITPDEVYGAWLAVRHLTAMGHRRIGYISGPSEYYASVDRLNGYRQALAEAGVAYLPKLVQSGDWKPDGGYAAMSALLHRNPLPSAVFVGNDRMAMGAIYALQDAGLQVPQDMALVSYDNIEVAAVFRPHLTTVTLPCYEMGEASAQMLLAMMNGEDVVADEVKIRGELIVRDSCGARGMGDATVWTGGTE